LVEPKRYPLSRAIIAEDVVFWLRASDVLHRLSLAEAD
jgi:hypothetical protein